ncbi:MAG TPA: RagB/SusD family nutrient uptake outer membrane protein [Cyclobacteriaceae bacterium]|jgi:hypothetical protein|nr:RagB/SusD family nutrient uptake outer membrane protein [Cyclobacteriaceae bacterium]
MKKISKVFILLISLFIVSCHDELSKVSNTNQPTPAALQGELGLTSFAKGGVYYNGFGGNGGGTAPAYYPTLDDGLGEGMLLIVYGLHDAMGDLIFIPWGNNDFKFADNPTSFTLDDNSVVPMPIGLSQPHELKLRNSRAYGPTNTMLLEWTYMYFMNNACNIILANVDGTTFTGDAATKKATLKAWAHFWKGYLYARLGNMYIAGLIVDTPGATNGNYVTNSDLLVESNKNYDAAITDLGSATDGPSYNFVMNGLIPGQCQAGKGGIPTQAQFIRNVNTMKARTALISKRLKDMTAADWTNITTLTTAGIKATDPVFVMKTTQDINHSYVDPQFSGVGSYTSGSGGTFYLSERLVQDMDTTNDTRYQNNINVLSSPVVNLRGRGLGFGTRFNLVDGGTSEDDGAVADGATPWVHVSDYGVDDIYMAGSFEENQLMLAEAKIHSGDIPGGLAIIDAVRAYQKAGLPALNSSTINTVPLAMEEIRKERRISLIFRGLGFYDARRMGITDDVSLGGGRAKAVVLSAATDGTTIVNKNAFINYNYLPYFDVPLNELDFNMNIGTVPVATNILK